MNVHLHVHGCCLVIIRLLIQMIFIILLLLRMMLLLVAITILVGARRRVLVDSEGRSSRALHLVSRNEASSWSSFS